MDFTRSRENATDIRDALNSEPSRVFRQVVAMEIIWVVEPGKDCFRDWELELRAAVSGAEPSGYAACGEVSEVEELTPGAPGAGG